MRSSEVQTFNSCEPLDDDTPWCYTRPVKVARSGYVPSYTNLQEDAEGYSPNWGYCPPSCSGELPSPTSKYSLATKSNLWDVATFDLSSWGSGVCYTYNPPAEVRALFKKTSSKMRVAPWKPACNVLSFPRHLSCLSCPSLSFLK